MSQRARGRVPTCFTLLVVDTHCCVSVCVIKLQLTRVLTLMELNRLRRQFISFTKSRVTDDTLKLADVFVQFINNRIQ